MVLTFALCASFVFAQTANLHAPKASMAQTKAVQAQNTPSKGLFTKPGTTLMTVDFHDGTPDNNNVVTGTGYTTGIVSTGIEAHQESADYAFWRRIANVESATLTNQISTYPALAQNYFGGNENFVTYIARYCDTATSSAENGFMMMSLYDQRTPQSGNFNAYIKLSAIDASAASVLDVEFFQYYRKYYDYCYLDYSVNGTSWTETAINVRGVDVSVNGTLSGMATYTLPVAAAGQANLEIRIRYKSPNSSRNAYGYFWILDDVSVISADPDRLRTYGQEYVDGNYSLIPNGLDLNIAWYGYVLNNGANTQNNVNVDINHLNANRSGETLLTSYDNGSINASADMGLVCDPHGLMNIDSLDYRGWFGYADPAHPHGTGAGVIPSATAGDNYLYAALTTQAGFEYNYDTVYYNVTSADADGNYIWGHDNGILVYTPYNYWVFGFINVNNQWYVTEDIDEVNFDQPGYTVTTRYTTGNTVPSNWVIRGVELVASPLDGLHSTGSRISATLIKDSFVVDQVYFTTLYTGADVHEVAANEVNDTAWVGRSNGYRLLGDYNTVRIMFPEQPRLEANTSYRIGYSIEEPSPFCVAAQAEGYYRMASPTRPDEYDTLLYFRNDPTMKKYGETHVVNQYETYINDNTRDDDPSTFASYNSEAVPMIRMLVGPERAVQRHSITISCENEEFGAAYFNQTIACGSTVTPVEGTNPVITFRANAGCRLVSLVIDGETVTPFDEITEEGDENFTYPDPEDSTVMQYQFEQLSGDHTVTAVFGEVEVSIDPIASNVHMNLQPNPASAQVTLNVTGVTGMLNCAIIDMSGRVVYNTNFNAENSQVINLNNLAKGAYFVRITNNNFSKVEKLIVR